MKIGELSERTGASIRMLRYYQEQGLLEPTRTAAGYRVYADSDVDRVARIRCMLSAALPAPVVLSTLRFLLDERAPERPADREEMAKTLQTELDGLEAKINALQESRRLLTLVLDDVRTEVVGPANPGDPAGCAPRPAVLKSGPGVGAAREGR